MRLYTRAQFLTRVPAGVIYCSGRPFAFSNLQVKGPTSGNDFLTLGLQWIEANSSTEATDRLERMLQLGESYPMECDYGRDGSFDDEEVFLVFEKADLVRLIGYCCEAIAVLP